jgi:hypothetical protein
MSRGPSKTREGREPTSNTQEVLVKNRGLKFGLAAVLAGATMAMTAAPASAQGWHGGGGGGGHSGYSGGGHGGYSGGGHSGYSGGHGGYGRGYGGYYGGYGWGPAVVGGLAGLAIGSALADSYDDGYGYSCGTVWDPYYGEYVPAPGC